MEIYQSVIKMCTQRGAQRDEGANGPPAALIYDRVMKAIADYLTCSVLPTLVNTRGPQLLAGLLERWENHKLMRKASGPGRWGGGLCS